MHMNIDIFCDFWQEPQLNVQSITSGLYSVRRIYEQNVAIAKDIIQVISRYFLRSNGFETYAVKLFEKRARERLNAC